MTSAFEKDQSLLSLVSAIKVAHSGSELAEDRKPNAFRMKSGYFKRWRKGLER